MKKKNAILLATFAAGVAYSAYEGKGIFNKIRFKSVHEAVSSYVNSHYSNAYYSPISATQKGYITTITTSAGEKILLYITRSKENIFVFKEEVIC